MSVAFMVRCLSSRLKDDGCDPDVVDAALALDDEQANTPLTGAMAWAGRLPLSRKKRDRIVEEFGQGTEYAFAFDVATRRLARTTPDRERRLWCSLIGAGMAYYPETTVGGMLLSAGVVALTFTL